MSEFTKSSEATFHTSGLGMSLLQLMPRSPDVIARMKKKRRMSTSKSFLKHDHSAEPTHIGTIESPPRDITKRPNKIVH